MERIQREGIEPAGGDTLNQGWAADRSSQIQLRKQPADEVCRRQPALLHSHDAYGLVVTSGTRTKSHHRWQAVSHEDEIRPQPRGASVAVGERMNSNPFGMSPSGQIRHGGNPVYVDVLPNRVASVECRDDRLELALKLRGFMVDGAGRKPLRRANEDACPSRARLVRSCGESASQSATKKFLH